MTVILPGQGGYTGTTMTNGRTRKPNALPGATATPTSPYATPGANLTSFGTGNDLRGTAILPTDSARTTAASTAADTAYGNYAGYQLPTFSSLSPYASKNSMDGIAPLTTTAVQGPDFTAARSALNPSAAEGYASQAASAMGGPIGAQGVSFNGAGALAGFEDAANATGGAFSYGGDTNAARAMTLQRLSQMQTPDRQKLALDTYQALADESAPQYEQTLRSVGQKAAALGRIGSGVTTNELGDVTLARERSLGNLRSQLAADAAGKALQDQIDYTGAASGVFGQFAGADQSAKGLDLQRASVLNSTAQGKLGVAQADTEAQGMNARNALEAGSLNLQRASQLRGLGQDAWQRSVDTAGLEERAGNARYMADTANTDRQLGVDRSNVQLAQDKVNFNEGRDRYGYESGVAERNAGWSAAKDRGTFLGQQAGALGDREGQQRTVDANNRTELRGERGYQNDMANKAQSDRIAAAQFAQWLQTQGIGNATTLYGAGQGGNVGGAYGDMASNYGQQAGGLYGSAGELAQLIPYLSQLKRGGATAAPIATTYSQPAWG